MSVWEVRGRMSGESDYSFATYEDGEVRFYGDTSRILPAFRSLIGQEISVTTEGPHLTGSEETADHAFYTVVVAYDEIENIVGDTPDPQIGVVD